MNDEEIFEAVRESFVDKSKANNSLYNFKLLSNRNEPLLNTITRLISNCDEFYMSVAFINMGGLQSIKMALANATKHGIKGRIIVGNKDNFSDPKAIEQLKQFDNLSIKLNMNGNLHTKGYFFRKDDVWTIVVGSSNLTSAALKVNEEWNFLLNSLNDGKIVEETLDEFNQLWDESNELEVSLTEYRVQYELSKVKLNELKNQLLLLEKIVPNKMQINALRGIEKARKRSNRALVISATGTGKTYLAAFDVKEVKPKKMLFIVHRENIARKALESFQRIIKDKTMGEFIGSKRTDADYVFCTIQTISKEDNMLKFARDEFDYIIIDEVHRAGASSYQKILDHFTPSFLLGLTATPERSDDFNIYKLFDYNIAYEIRLNEAIENNLIVPFHYYGVSEIVIDGEIIDEKTKVNMKAKALNIKKKSEFYSYDGNKVHGLIFVDNRDNAKELALELNKLGYRTLALTGETSESKRLKAIRLLEQTDMNKEHLDFIITVDIFNEGIDIPCVNQVLLLRPTQSVIIYVQQLGRGLRKAGNKAYLVILDFIGNYKNNFLVPIALSDDSTFNINYMNKFIDNGSQFLPGECTIDFEEVARNQILDKIDKTKFSNKNLIQHDYNILKQRLNRIPLLLDFYRQKMISPEFILTYKKTYPEVLKSIDKGYKNNFSDTELEYLKYLYQEFNMAKRIHETIIIKELLKGYKSLNELNEIVEGYLDIDNQIENTGNAMLHLEKKIFTKDNTRSKYNPIIINGELDIEFLESYQNNQEFKKLVDDYLEFNLVYNNDYYKQVDVNPLLLNHTYTRKEVFQLKNLDYSAAYQVGGYVFDKGSNTVLIFMKLDGSSYNNEFINEREFTWYAKNRTLGKSVLETKMANNEVNMELFVKRRKGEKEEYMGRVICTGYSELDKKIKYVLRMIL